MGAVLVLSQARDRASSPQREDARARPHVVTIDKLYRDHVDQIWRVIRRLGVPEAQAEDATHDVFLVAHRKLDTFEHRSTPRTWLHGIAIRVARRYRSRLGRTVPLMDDQLPTSERTLDGEVHRAQGLALLDRVLERMSDRKREVFILHEIEELPGREIGQILEIPMFTVYSRLRAARKQFDELLAQLAREETA